MLKNYIIIVLRNLKRQSLYSFINILGLAVGMACSLVIFLYVYGEWIHDRHFKNADRIYRIGVSFFNIGPFANAPKLLSDYIPKEFGGIEAYTRFQKNNESLTIGDRDFKENVYYVDSSFFDVFSYHFIEGDGKTSMVNPSDIVLTESMAAKYFPGGSAMGKMIEVGKNKDPYTVTGIVSDEEHNSHMNASVWVSLHPENIQDTRWTSAAVYTYVRLRENANQADLRQALDRVIANHVYPASGSQKSLEDYVKDENSVKFFITPLTDIYLKSKASLELSPGGNETNLYIFSLIALFILVLAGVNFINLSTARAVRRAKEVGIRKSLGTSRGNLIARFLTESVIVSLFSMMLALCLAEFFMVAFFWITGQPLSFRFLANPFYAGNILLFSIMVGLLAGIYPAFYLTAFKPVKVLKGNISHSGSKNFRNVLVVFQFSISIGLIIASTIVFRQLNFMSGKDLGFTQENVITIDNLYLLKNRSAGTFREQMMQQPGVTAASIHAGEPGSKTIISFNTYKTPEMTDALTINTYYGDPDYLDVMGFKLIKGRNFKKDFRSDTASVILNQSAVRALNLEGDPIGAEVNKGMKVIGVVSDFHWESLRLAIAPVVIMLRNGEINMLSYSQLSMKVQPSKASSVLQQVEAKWKEYVPGEPLKYHFLDENFGALLEKEAVLGKAVGFFTALAVLISCMGLLGLAAYTTEQRTKEIGIRKALGATVEDILLMLNRQFTILVLVASAIAIPVTYYAARQWLSDFAYHTDLNVWIFAGGCLIGLAINFATVFFHSMKASQTNPSQTLKCE